ncbi:hypothetical protein U1738_19980 [Sphingomonas sp. GB1N7]
MPGTITVGLANQDPASQDRAKTDDNDPFVRATQQALSNANFLVLPVGPQSRYVATIEVSQQQRGSVAADGAEDRPAANIGNGVSARVTLPSRKTSLHGLVVTRLHIEVRLRSDRHLVWSGSALTAQVSGTRDGSATAVGAKLANALVSQFPNTLQEPISVP